MQENELATDEPSLTMFPRAKYQLISGPHTRLKYCSPHGKDKTHGFSNPKEQWKLLLSLCTISGSVYRLLLLGF